MASIPPGAEIQWRQYSMNIELYKHYLELVLKFNIFYYAATGAIVSFYFSQSDVSALRYSLWFPIAMSFAYAAFFIYGAFLIEITRREVFAIRNALGLRSAPEFRVLTAMLGGSAFLFI